jgi:hypothetical protein
VTVRDHEVPPPGRGLEVRASGLWTELVCETALDHWSVGLEAFGVALDDPLEAWRSERGDPCALGLDVEWEGTEPCAPWPSGYSQACVAHGDVLVGSERFQLDGSGLRLHLWGEADRKRPSGWAAGRLDDGASFATTEVEVDCDEHGLVRSASLGHVTATALAHAPVLAPGSGRMARALCRYEGAAGSRGHGWAEWFHPGEGAAPA